MRVGGLASGDGHASRPVRAELHLSAVAAHAAVRGLRAARQRRARKLQLRDQPLYRRLADRADARRLRARAPRTSSDMLDASDHRVRPDVAHVRERRLRARARSPGDSLPEAELSPRRAPARGGPDARQPHGRGLRAGALRSAGAGRARSRRCARNSRRQRARRKTISRGPRRDLPSSTIDPRS